MTKSIHRLSESAVRSAINEGTEAKLPDGGGLRLDVKGGNASWMFRYVAPGSRKERYMGLGSAKAVSLDAARQLAVVARDLIKSGLDPIVERDRQPEAEQAGKGRIPTFEIAAERYIATHESEWKNSKHRQQWRNSLVTYAYPKIGSTLVNDLTTDDVAEMLKPIWLTKRETAARVRGRVEMVINATIAKKERAEANPALWGVVRHLLPLQRRKGSVKHHAALPYSQMPLFMKTLLADKSNAALALRFLIFTAARYSEAALARWDEVDLRGALWAVPADRMKAGLLHEVPLSGQAIAALQEAKRRFGDKGLIFPGQKPGKPLSDAAFSQAIDRNSIEHATTHGFRSTFRDWAGDETDVQREVVEAALAHSVGNEVEKAYRRGTALAKRKLLMTAWADYCASKVATGT
ncbi:tyrosine-type recombinase/integrase [Rhodopseudomonas sp. P2A-2r]|uniref:tyrosine-type recombinase/integrase n=1 Tax=Rhodopseudomonas sp. P2A-2r TaxID=2991972 RepID=UPI0022342142|nr:integrase arm-type DNA-binding domain-containing protein [Rhodopseudomonas sp. P2A-2r]UZE47018.1 tyrosine-type recombinase/integrase [Rhodopseudomonas sp. P2A-2r]